MLVIFNSLLSTPTGQNSAYFDTTFLADYDAVRDALCNDGFKDVIIPTEDGINLEGLLLERPHATMSVIVCCGFYPGRKEGMATMCHLLPDDCNILFFDARGHGNSEGRFWTALTSYGNNEFRDCVAAIEYMHTTCKQPIFVAAVCAGAFHATRALLHLQKKDLLTRYGVKGLIFDSGFSSVLESSDVPRKQIQHKIMPSLFTKLYKNDSKKKVQERYLYQIAWFFVASCIKCFEFCIKPFLRSDDSQICLMHSLHRLHCPIFFIHAKNDALVDCQIAMALAEKAQQPTCWWINDSEHACNHLKHAQEYRMRIEDFIRNVLET